MKKRVAMPMKHLFSAVTNLLWYETPIFFTIQSILMDKVRPRPFFLVECPI